MVDIEKSVEVLDRVLQVVGKDSISEDAGNQVLHTLTEVVKGSISDITLRHDLANSAQIWRLIKVNLEQFPSGELKELKLRLIRGVVLLARNLLSVDRDIAERIQLRHSIFKFGSNLQNVKDNIEDSLYQNCLVSIFQCLSNLTVNKTEHDQEVLDELLVVFNTPVTWNETTLHPIFTYFKNIIDSQDFLYRALSKGEGKPIFDVLLCEFEKLDLEGDLSQYGILLVSIFNKLIIHESFLKFITTYNEPSSTIRYLKIAEAIITSKESWEVFELTVILSWVYELLQKSIPEVKEYFDKVSADEPLFLYEKILRSMDILSSLTKFEHSRKFFLSYEGVQTFVGLLGILHQNIKPKKLKDQEKSKVDDSQKVDYRNFPHVKSLIIETLSALVYQNFEVQELMREVHGLEIVLSNCIIDDNEPFIKERSIVCIRFLLLNNEKNQEFVSKLEAKEAVQNDALDEAGFEVEIIDGKVKLKQKPGYKPNP